MDLAAQISSPKPYGGFSDISSAITEVLGDFRDEPKPLVAAATTAVDPLAVPSGSCPKCIAVRKETASACPCCGLVYVRFHVSLVAPSTALIEQFIALHEKSAPVEEHARLLSRAALLGELPQVVRLYRIQLAREPSDAIARQVIDEAVKIASATLVAAVPVEPQARRNRNLMLMLMVAVFLATVTIKTVSTLH